MVSFSKISGVTPALALFAAISGVAAAPYPTDAKHATHRRRELPGGATIESYQPPVTYETFGDGIDHPLAKRQVSATIQEAAISFLESRLGIKKEDLRLKSSSVAETARHVYVKQRINGLDVANAVANVALNKNDKVVAFGANFVKPSRVSSRTPKLTEAEAIAKAEAALGGTRVDWPVTLEYFIKENDHAILTYVVQVRTPEEDHWYEGFVDAQTGEIVSVTDFTADASYRVIPIQKQDPREGFELLTDPQDTVASPNGWHNTGSTTTTNTSGNNVIAYKGTESGVTTQSSATNNYDYTFNAAGEPTTAPNVDVARTNAFYVGNTIHDILYRYGFTETAFNFQSNNLGKGGAQNDRVLISVQDSSGTNNANFATPADGQSGRMRMYTWTYTTPRRDGDLENDIIVHEYGHGLSNRMTGGGTGRCLQTTEAGGLGEGWSDALAAWTERKSATVNDFTLGSYVTNNAAGIRTYPYSVSKTTNPLMYSNVASLTQVHRIGEVWALTLHSVYNQLVTALGFDINAKTTPSSTAGNAVFLHLFVDALALQPCNPTFLTARTAWIQADQNRYGGANSCAIWRGFAYRGLGPNASRGVNDQTVPAGC